MAREHPGGATEPEQLPVQVFPVVIGEYDHFPQLDVETEAKKIAEIFEDFHGEHEPWDAPTTGRDVKVVTARLGEWAAPRRRHHTVLYWAGHGWSDGTTAALAYADSPVHVEVDGLQPVYLAAKIALREKSPAGDGTWAMVILDACQSARFAELLDAAMKSDPVGARHVMLVGTSGDGAAWLGGFSTALRDCLRTDFGAQTEVSLWRLGEQVATRLPHGTIVPAPRLATATLNRRFPVAAGQAVTVDVRDELEALLAKLSPDERRHFIPKTQGGEASELLWFFQGREAEARTISEWLRRERTGMLVVTGRPGSGKSALLGHLLAQSRPELRETLTRHRLARPLPDAARPPDSVFDAALLLTGASVADVVARLAAALNLDRPPAGAGVRELGDWLVAELWRRRPRELLSRRMRVTILVDGLDEAEDPFILADSLLRPLAAVAGVRVIVGTRRSTMEGPDQPDPGTRDLLDRLASGASKPTEIVVGRDSEAIEAYVRRRLAAAISSGRLNARPVRVDAVATAITRAIDERELEFLFARLAVHEVIARPELLDPEHEGELTRLLAGTHRQLFAAAVDRLGTVAPVNRVLLEALAFGLGRGLPTIGDIWTTVAEAVSLEATGDASETQGLFTDHWSRIDRLMHDAAPYLMMDTEDEQTVYRLAHRTFQEHFLGLRPQQPHRVARVHERVTALLIDAAPANADRPLNPYLLRHLSGHAARSGLPGWLRLAARPDLLDRLDQRALAADAWSGEFGLPSLPAEIAGVIGVACAGWRRPEPPPRSSQLIPSARPPRGP